tara:strand:- start:869 stop:1255 length:387 start_codon:yes stop_codon:yes gene_type:complete
MSSIETSFVIASKQPKELAEFYAKVHETDISKGISSDHYLVPVSDGLNIHFYLSSDHFNMPKKVRSACLCFERRSSSDPLSIVKEWSIEIQKIGGFIIEAPKNESFGAEAWLSDPEGNDFLIFVPTSY